MRTFEMNLKEIAKDNDDFRRVLYTTRYTQLVVMALPPQEEIGEEVHTVDQILYLIDGEGEAIVAGQRHSVEKGDIVIVPAGVRHNVRNTEDEPLKLFTIYASPEHAVGTVHHTKAEAEAAEAVLAATALG
jgi:mannose-6-phosphate isomerase-like protein (cupin superfamily)